MSLKLGGLHEKHAVATWNLGTISAFVLKPKIVFVIVKKSVHTSKKTPHFAITKINCLMLSRKLSLFALINVTKSVKAEYSVNDH
jgi:hypothetical protein